jgi:hypothetical protein
MKLYETVSAAATSILRQNIDPERSSYKPIAAGNISVVELQYSGVTFSESPEFWNQVISSLNIGELIHDSCGVFLVLKPGSVISAMMGSARELEITRTKSIVLSFQGNALISVCYDGDRYVRPLGGSTQMATVQ